MTKNPRMRDPTDREEGKLFRASAFLFLYEKLVGITREPGWCVQVLNAFASLELKILAVSHFLR